MAKSSTSESKRNNFISHFIASSISSAPQEEEMFQQIQYF